MVILFEIPLLNRAYADILLRNNANLNYIVFWILGFSLFAFIITLIREIIKDTEDLEGDDAYGNNTIPIALGIKTTKAIIISLIAITIFMLLFVYFKYLNDKYTLSYLLVFLISIPESNHWVLII